MEAQTILDAALRDGISCEQAIFLIVRALKEKWPRMSRRAANQTALEAVQAREPFTIPLDDTAPEWAKALVRRARQIDRKNGREGTITVDEVIDRFRRQDGCCHLSGIRFSAEPYFPKALVPRPFAPSLDQEQPGLRYAPSNVRLVCTAANFAKNSWSMEVLLALAEGVVNTRVLHYRSEEQ